MAAFRLVGCALALCCGGLAGGAASAVAKRASQPQIGSGHRRFIPVLGDWEGVADGLPASFELAYKPQFVREYHTSAYGFSNLTFAEPCGVAGSTQFSGADQGLFGPVRRNGSFDESSFPGGLTGSDTARVSASFTVASCDRKLVWRLKPAHRPLVRDGTWRLTYSDGESAPFSVTAGGRLAQGISLPGNGLADCGVLVAGQVDLFIAAGGGLSYHDPGSIDLTLSLGRSSGSGEITFVGGTCASASFSATATLASPGG